MLPCITNRAGDSNARTLTVAPSNKPLRILRLHSKGWIVHLRFLRFQPTKMSLLSRLSAMSPPARDTSCTVRSSSTCLVLPQNSLQDISYSLCRLAITKGVRSSGHLIVFHLVV